MDIVRAIQITSPITGNPVTPKLTERRFGDKIYIEAVWIDPNSGAFIRKGVTKILDATTRKDITSSCSVG